MATTITSNLKAGRKWSVDSSGITTLKRDYVVQTSDTNFGADGEAVSFTGVPTIGSAHPSYPGLYVQSYDVVEGSGADKTTLVVTVNYGQETVETTTGEGAYSCAVDEWGWDDGTDEKELTSGVDGTQVLNSAGDPFESVPKVSTPAPTFRKTMRFKARQSGWADCNCKVNGSAVSIGGVSYPEGSLLCSCCEKRIIGDANWKYQYTVSLKYKSNPVKIAQAKTVTDVGWDAAVADAGMRELVASSESESSTKVKRIIRLVDKETGKLCTVTSAALLDGSGSPLSEGGDPYNFRFQAYERATFPAWFYSEPS